MDRSSLRPSGRLHYSGPSMNPTMQSGDILQVVPYGNQPVRCGDVIVFRPVTDERTITHRVVAVTADGVRARGDNNINIDPWVLTPAEIVGRVTEIGRGRRTLRIAGGKIGCALGLALRVRRRAVQVMVAVVRPAYLALAWTGLVRAIIPVQRDLRLGTFKRPCGTELKLMLGRRLVATRLPNSDRWQIRPPYRLLLDTKAMTNEHE